MSDKQKPQKHQIEGSDKDDKAPASKKPRQTVEASGSSSLQQQEQPKDQVRAGSAIESKDERKTISEDADMKTAIEDAGSQKSDFTSGSMTIPENPSPTPTELEELVNILDLPERPAARMDNYREQAAIRSDSSVSTNKESLKSSKTDSEPKEKYEGGDARFVQSDVDVRVDNLRMDNDDTEAPGPSGSNVAVANRVEPDAHFVDDPLDVSMHSVGSSSDEYAISDDKKQKKKKHNEN